MNNFYSLIIVAILFFECNEKGTILKNNGMDSNTAQIVLDSNILKFKNKSALEIYIDQYSDSINKCSFNSFKSIPSFLKDPDFDYHNNGIWAPSHHPLSLRKLIVNNITNCRCLQELIKSPDPILKKRPTLKKDVDLEYFNLSFYDLLLRQSDTLKCE